MARVNVAPDAAEDPPWDSYSWAYMLNTATSVGSTLFFNEPRLRMPAQIQHRKSCPSGGVASGNLFRKTTFNKQCGPHLWAW